MKEATTPYEVATNCESLCVHYQKAMIEWLKNERTHNWIYPLSWQLLEITVNTALQNLMRDGLF